MSGPERPDGEFIAGFMDDYFAECDEHLSDIRRVLEASDGGLGAQGVEDLFRSFHSLKGLSGMVELREAELLAHEMEEYLRLLRGGEVAFTRSGHEALVQGTRALEQVIAARRLEAACPAVDGILAQLAALANHPPPPQAAGGPAVPAGVPSRWKVTFVPSPDLAARGINVDLVRKRLRDTARLVEAVPRIGADGAISFEFVIENLPGGVAPPEWSEEGISVAAVVAASAAATKEDPPEAGRAADAILNPSHFVRVDLARLDDLMRMIGDLVISRARLGESLAQVEGAVAAVNWRPVQENSLAIERQLRDLREGVMRLRLVPVGEIFRRMSFVVRDLARESGKAVDLRLSGQDTEIDKFLVERMMDPVLHLVRNAVTHGIEAPAVRAARGKPESGHLLLSAASVGDIVTLEIADDGGGVDAASVVARARAMGMTVPDDPDAAALLDILCAPGFSTRDAADRAAGRGVGMNVVQSTVRELGGSLAIDTAPGEGTRFILQLPVSLAIADAIIATVGSQTFAVPQSAVREVLEVEPASLRAIEKHEIAPYRGGVLPLVRLSSLFGITPAPRSTLHVFVIGQGLAAVGLVVDRIAGQREVVVRPMIDPLVRVEGVMGATDLGDGRVVLILDPLRLTHVAASTVTA